MIMISVRKILVGIIFFLQPMICFSSEIEGKWMSVMTRRSSFEGVYRVGLDISKERASLIKIFAETSSTKTTKLFTPGYAQSDFKILKMVVSGASTVFSCATQAGKFYLVSKDESLLMLDESGEISDYFIKRDFGTEEALKEFVEGAEVERLLDSMMNSGTKSMEK